MKEGYSSYANIIICTVCIIILGNNCLGFAVYVVTWTKCENYYNFDKKCEIFGTQITFDMLCAVKSSNLLEKLKQEVNFQMYGENTYNYYCTIIVNTYIHI